MNVYRWTSRAAMYSLVVAGLLGCTTGETQFLYQDLPVAKESAMAGHGHTITLNGKALQLRGPGIQVGDRLRSIEVTKGDLSLVDIAETKGRVRIISIVPSIDTKVCEQQTHHLSEKNAGLDQTVELITVSVDTPFAQSRFAKDANIQNVTFLSDYRGGRFGMAYGLLVEEPHLLARTVMVVDEDNVIRYMQVTPELAEMPDMEAAFKAARSLIASTQA